ncbi:MAG: hypothetical protein LBW77_04990 [Verrucomicrobiota bacterium]|jgi:uncharacterized BrkB/YihY/UPF0761 family membrane protein|nr:hypothetical protein [Verrucomicrobiota bacterium]
MMDPREWTDEEGLKRLLALFGVFGVVCLLAGASRMCPPAWQLRPFGDVLRVREALSMFVFAPAVGVVFWLLVRAVARGRPSRWVEALMLLTVYFVACGMGLHDPANRLEAVYRGGQALSPEALRSIRYLDDGLGHWVFWGGFVLGTWVFGLQQLLSPLREKMAWRWRCGFGAVAAALLWVVLTNLWDEYPKTRADLCVIAGAVAVPLAFHLAARRRVGLARLPALFVIYPVYLGGIAGTLVCWLVRYGKV